MASFESEAVALPEEDSSSKQKSNSVAADEDLAQDEHELLKSARSKLTELYEIHDYFFSHDKAEKRDMLATLVTEIQQLLDGVGEGANSAERASIAFIRGRAYDALEGHDDRAEDWLSRAVKLDPLNFMTWNAMGHCIWKRGNLAGAKHCFERGVELKANKDSLQQLSMLLRSIPASEVQERAKNIHESVEKARQAVALDVEDDYSWYILGNAYCGLFFQVSHSVADLGKALRAYSRADANGGTHNPDLFFNRGNVLRYKEDYHEAVKNYQAAKDLDPSLPTEDCIQDIERHVRRASDLIAKRGRLKPKRIAKIRQSLASVSVPEAVADCEAIGIAGLQDGDNAAKLLNLRILMPLSSSDVPPESFLVIDSAGDVTTISMYDITRKESSSLVENTLIQVANPQLRRVVYSNNGMDARYSFLCVQNPSNVYVNGTAMKIAFQNEVQFANFDS